MARRARSDAAPPAIVHVEIGCERRCGQWVDAREFDVGVNQLVDAVRRSRSTADVVVRCPDPGPAFEHVGAITFDADIELRSALAVVARRRGHESPREAELVAVREELAELSVDDCDAAAARRAVANAGDAERELSERVATLRGRLQERETDDEQSESSDDLAAALDDAVAELSEVRTDRIAAQQRLARERKRARDVRNRRERRLELQDRERNLERAVREDLAEAVYPAFVDALAGVPGSARPGDSPSAFRGDDVTAALALARLAPSAAPVVLGVDRFASPAVAARRLRRPVLRV